MDNYEIPMMPWELHDLKIAAENFMQKCSWSKTGGAFRADRDNFGNSLVLRNNAGDAYLLWYVAKDILRVSTYQDTLWRHWNVVMQATKLPLKFIGMVPPHAQIDTPWGIRSVGINRWRDVIDLMDPNYG
jgi:hypothetical protein